MRTFWMACLSSVSVEGIVVSSAIWIVDMDREGELDAFELGEATKSLLA